MSVQVFCSDLAVISKESSGITLAMLPPNKNDNQTLFKSHSELPRLIPWKQTSDAHVHRGSNIIT